MPVVGSRHIRVALSPVLRV